MPNELYSVAAALERALSKFVIHESGCWLWTGRQNSGGYGQLNVRGKPVVAHRFLYEQLIGAIPEGLQLDHVRDRGCLYRHCVNVFEHLEPVTPLVNIRRGIRAVADHCINGHLLDEANIYVPPGKEGHRVCRTCLSVRAKAGYQPTPRVRKTHCSHGHEFTEENTYVVSKTGARLCRACIKGRYQAKGSANGQKTHCKYGHEFTTENIFVNRNGGRVCRECMRVRARATYKARKREPSSHPSTMY